MGGAASSIPREQGVWEVNGRSDNLRVFAGSSHPALAAEIACQLGVPLGELLDALRRG